MAACGNTSGVVSGNSTINDTGGSHILVGGANVTEGAPDQICAVGRTTSERDFKNSFENIGVISESAIAQNKFGDIGRDLTIINYPPHNEMNSSSTENSTGLRRSEWTKLVEYYGDESWMKPFPWDPDIQIDPEKFYVPLTLDNYGRAGKEKEMDAELNQLFDCISEGGDIRAKRVLIRGKGGFGKSTICMKVVYDWSCGKDTFSALSNKDFVPFLYKLRFMDSSMNLETELYNFARSMHCPKQKNDESTKNVLKELGENILIVLDGYDEVASQVQEHVKQFISRCKRGESLLFNFPSFLVTSRPNNDKGFLSVFQKHYYISDLSFSKTEEFVCRYNRCDIRVAREYLRIHANLDFLSMSPFSIFIFCWVTKQESLEYFMKNKELNVYFNYIVLQAKSCNRRDGYNFPEEEILRMLFELGRLCINRVTFTEEFLLRHFPSKCCRFLFHIGVFRFANTRYDDLLVYEPVHKYFLESLVQYTFHSSLENCQSKTDFLNYLLSPICATFDYSEFELRVILSIRGDVEIEIRDLENKYSFSLLSVKFKPGRAGLQSFRPATRYYDLVIKNIVLSVEQLTSLLFVIDTKGKLDERSSNFYHAILSGKVVVQSCIKFESSADCRIAKVLNWVPVIADQIEFLFNLRNDRMLCKEFSEIVEVLTGQKTTEISESTNLFEFLKHNSTISLQSGEKLEVYFADADSSCGDDRSLYVVFKFRFKEETRKTSDYYQGSSRKGNMRHISLHCSAYSGTRNTFRFLKNIRTSIIPVDISLGTIRSANLDDRPENCQIKFMPLKFRKAR